MTNKIRTAFDCIHAEDALKMNAVLYIRNQMRKRKKIYSRFINSRLATAAAAITFIIVSGVFSLYFTASAYVDLDVNPSVGLTVNRFDRIIGVHPYNAEGMELLSNLNIKHRQYLDAVKSLINTLDEKGFLSNDGLVSVTLQMNDTIREGERVADIQAEVTAIINEHDRAVQVDVFSVSANTRSHAHELNVTPAKYLAITDYMLVDPNATFDECKNHSIDEIKGMARDHADNNHSGSDTGHHSDSSTSHHAGDHN